VRPAARLELRRLPEDDRSERVIERAAFLFRHYAEAQKKQDAQMLSVLRGDLRKLNVEASDS
jgi:hypothetical protein